MIDSRLLDSLVIDDEELFQLTFGRSRTCKLHPSPLPKWVIHFDPEIAVRAMVGDPPDPKQDPNPS